MAAIREKFEKIMRAYTTPNDSLAVAVSGGADSMCLLSLCLTSDYIRKDNLAVVSVDHMIRGENSARDLQFVGEFCAQNGVKFLPYTVDVPARAKESGRSIETEARAARREIFDALYCNGSEDAGIRPDIFLLAHHTQDNAESILMHLFRGSGLNGLCGMEYDSGGQSYLRPLLDVSKDEIDLYVKERAVPFVTDETNSDVRYTRNFIRSEVMPRIKEKYPGAERAILNLGKEIRATLDYIEKEIDPGIYEIELAKRPYAPFPDIVKIRIAALKEPVFSARCIIGAFKRFVGYKCLDIERKHIELILGLVHAENGSRVDLPGLFRAVREYEFITLYQAFDSWKDRSVEKKFATGITEFFCGLSVEHKITVRKCKAMPEKKRNGILYFDLKKIPSGAIFRYRRDGDIFKPYGGGTKKLKEYLIDKKIPVRMRDNLICLACGNEILAVAGVEISDNIKAEKDSDIYSLAIVE